MEDELTQKFRVFEQQIMALQQQLQAVEQAIMEISSLDIGLSELVGKKDNEILAPLGKGIFAKAKLISEDLIVEVGEKNFVKKTIPETKELIQEQVKKLEEIRNELNKELDNINQDLTKTMIDHQSKHAHEGCGCSGKEDSCECGDSCSCH